VTDPIAGLNAALGDRYVVDRELGRGGMALVYLARDLRHERFVALKTLRAEIAVAVGRDRFLREIKLAARLQHPNILPVYDSGDAGGTLYYVMPFVEGESLRDRLAREPQLPLEEALQIAREVADALSYAHGHDVVHRDIKPENIMMSGGHAIVADFGIARAVSAAGGDKLTETGLAIGTPAYMSPEQAAGTGQVDRRSDIYSLGCVLYETLAGQPPFTGPTAQAIMARHSLDAVPRLKIVRETIPDALEDVINRALAKVPADRYQTAEQFAHAMAAASTGTVSRVTAAPRLPAPVKRRWLVLAAALVAVLAGLGWMVFGGKGNAGPPAAGGLDPHRVAVLYFADASPDSSLGYLADGLTEALIADLGEVRTLDLVSRSGVAAFRGRAVERDSVARALDAGTLVEGDVESAGRRVRVTVRLVDGESGADIRRQSFELPAGDQLSIRDSLAQQVALFLRELLGPEIRLREERAGTKSVDAWTLVQRAERARKDAQAASFWGADWAPAVRRAAEADSLLAAAERADARWAVPPTLRGRVAYERSRFERTPADAERFLQTGLAHAERALGLDARSADALELRGTLRFRRLELGLEPDSKRAERLLDAAEADLVAATKANPAQVGAWSILSVLYYQKQDNVQANWAARRAYEADAYLSAAEQVLWRLYITSYDLEQFQQAADWCAKGRQRFPQNGKFLECRLWLMTSGALAADPEEAWRLAGQVAAARPGPQQEYALHLMHIIVASVLGRANLSDSARRVLERARAGADVDPTHELPGYEAWVRTQLGDKDEALRLLREYLVANPRHHVGFKKRVHWWWRPLQHDPRFKALMAS
jgi:serine/threonine-protein kinase